VRRFSALIAIVSEQVFGRVDQRQSLQRWCKDILVACDGVALSGRLRFGRDVILTCEVLVIL
jgi:hypothetical protein